MTVAVIWMSDRSAVEGRKFGLFGLLLLERPQNIKSRQNIEPEYVPELNQDAAVVHHSIWSATPLCLLFVQTWKQLLGATGDTSPKFKNTFSYTVSAWPTLIQRF